MNEQEIMAKIKKEIPLWKLVLIAPIEVLDEVLNTPIIRITTLFLALVAIMLAVKVAQVGFSQTLPSIQENIHQFEEKAPLINRIGVILFGIILFVGIRDIYHSLNIVRLHLCLKALEDEDF